MGDFVIHVDTDVREIQFTEADVAPLLEQLGAWMLQLEQERFAGGYGPDGPWAPLSASTIKSKGGAGQILVDTGALRGSFVVENDGASLVTLGTGVFYSIFHQYGTVKMPQRTILGFNAAESAEIGEMVNAFLSSMFGG